MGPTLFIGMPVFNGQRFIQKAIDSLLGQTYTNWVIFISDNCSDDLTSAICEKYVKKDPRITYHKREINVGAMLNFKYCLEVCNQDYFMWASCDDIWEANYIEECMDNLLKTNALLSFSDIINIDSYDQKIREYASFGKLVHTDATCRIISYLLDPECFGKANLIYGIYSLNQTKKKMLSFLSSSLVDRPGADMALVLSVLCSGDLVVSPKVLFNKRHVRTTDVPGKIVMHTYPKAPHLNSFSLNDFKLYKEAILYAVAETSYSHITRLIMESREKAISDYTNAFADVPLSLSIKTKKILKNGKVKGMAMIARIIKI